MKKISLLLFTTILLVSCIDNSDLTSCPCIVTSVEQNGTIYYIRVNGQRSNTTLGNSFGLRSITKVNVGDTLKFVPIK